MARTNQKNKTMHLPISKFGTVSKHSNGGYSLTLKVSSLNVELMPENNVVSVMEACFNAFNQIDREKFNLHVVSETIDTTKHLNYLDQEYNSLTGTTDEVSYLQEIVDNKKVYFETVGETEQVLSFYISIRTGLKKFEEAQERLEEVADTIHQFLSSENMFCSLLNEVELKKTVYMMSHKFSGHSDLIDASSDETVVFPSVIKKSKDNKFLEVDDFYYKHYYISSFPSTVEPYRWLNSLIKLKHDFSLTISCSPKNLKDEKFQSSLNRNINMIKGDVNQDSEEIGRSKKLRQLHTAKKFAEIISGEEENIFDTIFSFSLFSDDKELLKSDARKFVRSAAGKGFKLVEALEERTKYDMFFNHLPIGHQTSEMYDHYRWNFSSEELASLCLFDSPEFMEVGGTVIAQNLVLNGKVFKGRGFLSVNRKNQQLHENGHVHISGTSGAGKTVLTSDVIIDELPKHDNTIVFDIKGDYFYPIGKRYDFSTYSKDQVCVNIFHINEIDKLDQMSEKEVANIVNARITDFLSFIKYKAKELTLYQIALIQKDLNYMFYEHVDIVKNKRQCTLSDWDKAVNHLIDSDDDTKSDERKTRKSLLILLYDIVHGVYSGYFNGENNFDLNHRLVVLGLNDVKEEVFKPLMNVLARQVNNYIRSYGTMNTNWIHVVFDEYHKYLDKENPSMTTFLAKDMSKEIRGFRCNVTFATQELSDVDEVPNASSIREMCHIKIYLTATEDDVEKLQKKYRLSENEASLIKSKAGSLAEFEANKMDAKNKGKGICFIGSRRFAIHHVLDEFHAEISSPQFYQFKYGKASRYLNLRKA